MIIVFSFIFINACTSSKNSSNPNPSPIPMIQPTFSPSSNSCVKIYYDRSPIPGYTTGYSQALLLNNLISHFTLGQKFVTPIENYQPGDLLSCSYNFYLGSFYNNILPTAFLMDSMNNSTSLVWMGYNIWQSGSLFINQFGYRFYGLSKLNHFIRNNYGSPSFFSTIIYKNNVFNKDTREQQFIKNDLPYEMAILNPVLNPAPSQILAFAKNPWSNEILPYVIKQLNKYYFSDIPLTYMHETQQYLVLADLLFDIFNFPSLQQHPRVGISISINNYEAINAHTLDFISDLNQLKIPYFISFDPKTQQIKGKYIFNLSSTNNILKISEGLFWDIRSAKNANTILDFISILKKQQNQLIKSNLHPISIIDMQPSESALENSILSQLFTNKIGLSVVSNFFSLTPETRTNLPLTNFPIPDSTFTSLSLQKPKLIDSFHQNQFTPYILQNDVSNQRVIPLLASIGEQTNTLKILDQIRALSVISDSTHFINIENTAFQTEKDIKRILDIVTFYKSQKYQFINKTFFKR